jgi:hypothetical protein
VLTDYKTLRFSGHYGWIQKQLIELKDQQTKLQPSKKMQAVIPQIEEDQIVLYAVKEKTSKGFAKTGSFKHIFPKSGKPSIKSYTTTAAPF